MQSRYLKITFKPKGVALCPHFSKKTLYLTNTVSAKVISVNFSLQGLHGKPGPRGQRGPTVCTFALQFRGFPILLASTIL